MQKIAFGFAAIAAAVGASAELTPMDWHEGDLVVPSGSILKVTEAHDNTKLDIHGTFVLDAPGKSFRVYGAGGTSTTMSLGAADGDDACLIVTNGSLGSLYNSRVNAPLNVGTDAEGASSVAKLDFCSGDTTHQFAALNFRKSLQPGEDGVIDAVSINHYVRLQPSTLCNYNTHPVRITFKNTRGPTAASWGFAALHIFYGGNFFDFPTAGGDFILRGAEGGKYTSAATAPIMLQGYAGTNCKLFGSNLKAVLRTEGNTDVVVDPGARDGYYLDFNATNVVWGHTGDFAVQYYYRNASYNSWIRTSVNNVLPYGAHMTGVIRLCSNANSAGKFSIDLYGTTQRMNALQLDNGSFITNRLPIRIGVLEFGHNDYTGSFIAGGPIRDPNVLVRKVGSGSMTLQKNATVPALDVQGGQLTVKTQTDFTLNALTVAAGATFVVDGVTVTVAGAADVRGTVSLLNGGQVVSAFDVPEQGRRVVRDSAMCGVGPVVKTGGGTLTFESDATAVSGDLHVSAGTVNFSAASVPDKWWRFTFKKIYGAASGKILYFDTIQMTDAAGKRVDSTGKEQTVPEALQDVFGIRCSSLTNAPIGTTEETLPENSVMSSDTRWAIVGNGNYRCGPSVLFMDANYAGCSWNQSDVSAQPVTLTFRLKDSAQPVHQYRMAMGYANADTFPGVWTLESRDANGEWKLRDSRNEDFIRPASATAWTDSFKLGGEERTGSAGLADGVNVQVDSGATLDGGNVAGGEVISKITVDVALGGGTFKNVAFAETGTLALTGVTGRLGGLQVPLAFESVQGLANLANWSLVVNGQPKDRKLVVREGKVFVDEKGMILIFR